MQSWVNRQVKLVFEPLQIEILFERSLKLQIAIFRGSTDQKGKRVVKMDKTDPMKFNNPLEKIILKNTLSLLTTVQYDTTSKRYESKQVEFEMALDVDGTKSRMNKRLNLKDILANKQKTGKFMMQNPNVSLIYRADVKFQDEGDIQKEKETPAQKKIKFQEEIQVKEEMKENKIQPKAVRSDKSRHKTTIIGDIYPNGENLRKKDEQNQSRLKKYKSMSKRVDQYQVEPVKNSMEILKQEQSMSSDTKIKAIQFEAKFNEQKALNIGLQKKIKQKDAELMQLTQRVDQLEKKLMQAQDKAQRSAKQLIKKDQVSKQNYEKKISELQQEINCYKKEIQKLSKTALNYQESSKSIAFGSEVQIKILKDQVKKLEKTIQQNNLQVEQLEKQIKDKDQIISDLKSKIYHFQKQNLQMQNKVKGSQSKLHRITEDFKTQIQELQNRITQMKEQNKALKIPTQKQIKDEGVQELKKKIQVLEKQMIHKQELLRRMNQMKKQNQSEWNIQNASLKKQINELKEVISKLQSKKGDETTSISSIQYRVQMEKMKKQLQVCKKNQKAVLIEKGRLETNNRQLQDDVVKGKLIIANILNVVQETGDQKLISQAYSLTE